MNTVFDWAERLGLGAVSGRQLVLLLVAAVLAWLTLLMDFLDSNERQREAALGVKQEVELLNRLAQEDQWPDLQAQSTQRLGAFRETFWKARSEGAFEAAMQDWMIQLAGEQGLDLVSIDVRLELPPDESAGQRALPENTRVAHVEAGFNWDGPAFIALLKALALDARWNWVEGIEIDTKARQKKAGLTFAVYFLLDPQVQP